MRHGLFPVLVLLVVLAAAWRPLHEQQAPVESSRSRTSTMLQAPEATRDLGEATTSQGSSARLGAEDDRAQATATTSGRSGTAAEPQAAPQTPAVRVRGLRGMQPEARTAFDQALMAARQAGVPAAVRSGQRPAHIQQQIFEAAARRHGSARAALDEALPPERSAHVAGVAVDVSGRPAARWLQEHGAQHGICRRYANEWWHFEYVGSNTCPPLLPSPRYS